MQRRGRHPPNLRGREIGLWYAERNKINGKRPNKPDEVNEFLLDQRTIEKIVRAVKVADSDSHLSEVLQPFAKYDFEKSQSGFASVELQRNETLDKDLQVEMVRKVQTPRYLSMNSERRNLPTFAQKQDFLKMVDENQVVVVSGETGCGKTTQLPQYLLEHAVLRGHGSCTRIVVTQPRRISAISVAERVAAERGQPLGDDIGYQIRLETVPPKRPQGSILFCTTGIVLQWFHSDPLLKSISHVVVDEVHEREMLGDFLIAMLKRALPMRPDLRVILMSATLNSEKFSQFFNECPRLEIPGRTFPVETFYLEEVLHRTGFEMPPDALYRYNKANLRMAYMRQGFVGNPTITPAVRQSFKHWLNSSASKFSTATRQFLEVMDLYGCPPPELVAVVIDYIIKTTSSGAILAFVPGFGDIMDTMKALRNMDAKLYAEARGKVLLYGLHSRLPVASQRAVFVTPPAGTRKVVIATNIAETSITIEDVVYVVDTGQIKITSYDSRTNTSTLAPVLVSKANAAQRRGRAGRVCPGQCFHLFSSFTHDHVMSDFLPPEITRMRLEDIILRIKVLELGPVRSFLSTCMDPPNLETINRSLHFLREIQALRPLSLFNPTSDSVPVAQLSRMSTKRRNCLMADAIQAGKNEVEMEDDNILTPLGWYMADLPLDPQCSKLLLLGTLFCCLKPALAVSACLAFKDPFEVPLGLEARADARRTELTEDSQSDHWAFYVVLSRYMELGEREKYGYCQRNFLNRRTMEDLCRLMREFMDMLFERKYVTSRDMDEMAVNRYSYDVRIFRAILAGAFYPNLIMATVRRNKPEGSLSQPFISDPSSEKVTLHNKSVNALVRPRNQIWFTYFQKMKLDHGAASTIFDSTLLTARPVVFFSKITHLKLGDDAFLLVDNWVKFKSSPRLSQLVEHFKYCFERLLDDKIRHPRPTNWDPATAEGQLLQTIVDYLLNEAPAAFELAPNHRLREPRQHPIQRQS